ncbi:MAG: SH3 domain-containing protein [Anaerolineae bacterium]|nr:SH3 domain-containing protein [Anaerolineae bacterium]
MTRRLYFMAFMLLLLIVGGVSAANAQDGGGFGGYGCLQPARLTPSTFARVTTYPALPNRIRTDASYYSAVIGQIPAGATFEVLSGPVCDGRSYWWRVSYQGVVGWTVEGDGAYTYYLEPISVPTPPPPACGLPTRLYAGGSGRVTLTPNLPNVVRSGPGVGGTSRMGTIPAGGEFSILGGPNCAGDGRWWWYVNYRGLVGWTAEGDGATLTYWLEPVSYPPSPTCLLPNRLSAGGSGRVTPGLPNALRSAPGTRATGANSDVIGWIPGGAVFSVLSGPSCGSDGRWWWQVNYAGAVGWTAEGEGSNNYWVEPL